MRYNTREQWRKCAELYSQSYNSRTRMKNRRNMAGYQSVNASGGAFDTRGKFMKEIVNITNAASQTITNEQTDTSRNNSSVLASSK